MSGLPGVKIGPLDPDATSQFGQVSRTHSARTLIRLHSQAHPPALINALARPLDDARTKGLDLAEVREFVATLDRENGDPVLPDGSTIVGAAVRGKPDSEQVLTFTFENASGRTGKWFAPYTGDDLPDSYDAGTALSAIREMKDRGVVAFDTEGTHTQILQRENADLRRQNDALRGSIESRIGDKPGKPPKAPAGDTRPSVQIVDENERLGRENVELKERMAQLEAALETNLHAPPAAPAAAAGEREPAASAEPPIEGYDDLDARKVATLLKADATSDEDRNAILEYERAHANRKTVIGAAEGALGLAG